MRKEFKRGTPSSFCPFRTFRTSEKYLVLHVLLHDQKYQKSSKTFPLRYLPVVPALPKREQYIPSCANISSKPSDCRQRQKCRSNARVVCSTSLCAMPIYGRGSCLFLCQRTNFMHARHSFICGRGTKRIRESARLLRVMCSHAWYRESYGERLS